MVNIKLEKTSLFNSPCFQNVIVNKNYIRGIARTFEDWDQKTVFFWINKHDLKIKI